MTQPNLNTYSMTAKKIAVKIAKLPSEKFLTQRLTQRQLQAWNGQRFVHNLISLCWKANITGEDNPLWNLVESGKLSQKNHDFCWLWARFYRELWGLVQLAEPHVEAEAKKIGVDYPFKSAFRLFVHIISKQANNRFSACLQYQQISAPKYVEAYRLASRKYQGETLTPKQNKKIRTNLKQHKDEPWLALTLAVCEKKAISNHRALRSQLSAYKSALSEILDVQATRLRKRGSFAWKDGKRGRGTQAGTYDFS